MAIQSYVLRRGLAGDAFGTAFPVVTPTAKTTVGRGTIFALHHRAGEAGSIKWEYQFPGVKPATLQLDLQGCDGDPNVEANWYQLDTSTDVAANNMRVVVNKRPLFIAINVILITVPAGGVACTIVDS